MKTVFAAVGLLFVCVLVLGALAWSLAAMLDATDPERDE